MRAKPTGRYSQAIKYDIISSLLILATCGTATQARLSVRLSLVITARYNWRLGRFGVGQKELARMLGVTERTAKRELAHMRGLGWISVAVASGRGRVTQHSINLDSIIEQSAPHWEAIGPDFATRMVGTPEREISNVVLMRVNNIMSIVDNNTGRLLPKDYVNRSLLFLMHGCRNLPRLKVTPQKSFWPLPQSL